ncbi:MAG TPA: hypothetical protein VFQ79_07910, partial [Bryobacteraceae bacterium]|nr:hypothetical protein [Bryobacteraceae bacterium]
ARKRQDGSAKPPQLIRNEFGGSAGGPVLLPKIYDGRDRTFWFFTYEGNRTINPSTKGYQVPTEAMRNGDFTGLVDASGRQYAIYDPYTTNPATGEKQQISYQGRLNVIDPARMSPLAKYLYSITPLPTDPSVNPLIDNNWWGPAINTTRNWTTTARVDHRFSDYDQFYARYTQGDLFRINDFYGQPMLDNVAGTNRTLAPNKSLATSYLHTFSPTLFNELMVSVSRENAFSGTGEPGVYYNDMLGLPNPMGVPGWPGIYDTGLSSYYFETQNTNRAAFTNYILDNNATKIFGRHEFQFGGHLRYDQLNYLPEQQHPQGNHNFNSRATALVDPAGASTNPQPLPYTGSNLANMYLGLMNYSNQFVRGYFYARAKEYALYFQDNFRVNQRLTLNIGLRWEKWPAYYEKNNMMTSFDPASNRIVLGQDLDTMYRLGGSVPSIVNRLETLGAKFATYKEAGMPKHLMSSGWRDFGPRLGFAYRAGDGTGSFVLRGGYRVSYFPIPLAPWGQRMRQNAPLTARFVTSQTDAAQSPDGLPNWGMRSVPTVVAGVNSKDAVQLTNASLITRGQAVVSYFSPDQPDSKVHDWNFTIEKEVAKNTVARVAYLGNHVSNLEQYFRFNEATPEYIWYATTGTRLPTGEFASVARRPFNQEVYGTMEEYRKSGWSNFQGAQFELERRYSQGFAYQIFYNFGNAFTAGGKSYSGVVPNTNVFLPGAVPQDYDERNRLFNYQRDVTIPKHRLRWNWVADLPFGKGKKFGGNAGGVLDKVIGGWQITGMGSLWSSYWQMPTTVYPNGNNVEVYGYDYPIQDCRSGACRPGYLYWNGYINPNQINSYDANGKPNGVMGVPDNYKPAGQPLIPWPLNPSTSDPMYAYYGSNTVWVPLNDGTTQRVNFDDGLHPWRQQYLPGPRQWNVDASIVKNIRLTESVNLRFNADIFNVFNHPNNPAWTGSNTMPVAADGVYSTFTSGLESRELQLSLRLSW